MDARRLVVILGFSAGCTGDPGATDRAAPAAAPPAAVDPDTLATSNTGALRGAREGDTLVWRGIPYAAPPVGPLRWRLPRPPVRWDGERDATEFAPRCVQRVPGGVRIDGDEDCLYLNVFAPARARHGPPLPVMVWIHGGSRQRGSGELAAHALAARGLVVVTINYRLGQLGFLGHPAMTAESGTSGDWGFYDMIAALRWVRRNVRGFGGDAGRVTVAGQSAGASAVDALLVSPLARGLFQRAIAQSNFVGPGDTRSLADAERTGRTFAATFGCAGDDAAQLACLRALPAADVAAGPLFELIPPLLDVVDDGRLVRGDVAATLRARGAGVPLLTGSTRDEAAAGFVDGDIDDAGDVVAQLESDFGELSERIAPLYPADDYPAPVWALIAAESDGQVTCGVQRLAAEAAAARNAPPVYLYLFSSTLEGRGEEARLHAWHGADVAFVFGDWEHPDVFPDGGYLATPADEALAEQIQGYWSRFVATGDPNGGGAVLWPRLDASGRFLELDDVIAVGSAYHAAACDLFAPRR